MKKYLIYLLTISSSIFFTGCSDDLDVKNPAVLSLDQFITDGASAQVALNQAYNDLQQTYVGGAYPKMLGGIYSDNLNHTGSFPSFTEYWTNTILTDNANLTAFYRDNYDLINTTTEVIRVTSSLSSESITDSERNSVLGEAHALRAYAYFQLVKVFGGLPITERTVPLDGPDANNEPRKSESEVYEYILNEISEAEGKITDTSNDRFNSNALAVLKAKVNLYLGNYPVVESTLQPLIGQYSLSNSYSELFALGNNTSETIMRVSYNNADSNSLAFFFYPAPQGRREVAPSQNLLDSFEAGDVRKNMIINNTDANSAYLNKYQDAANGTDNPYIYRYADVLLMYAEVLARRNAPEASDYINMVRNRAGLGDVVLNSSNVVDLISNERRWEFFGEGDRWNDIKRLGIAGDIVQNNKSVGSWAPFKILWPIPQSEIDRNNSITQDNQNSGY